jgi:hypothetical protein
MKFYTIPCKFQNFFASYIEKAGLLTHSPELADFLVLPFMYEYIYDYSDFELRRIGITNEDFIHLVDCCNRLKYLSDILNKKLIIFFYRDPAVDLPFQNAIIFRTSIYKSKAQINTYGLPAFIEHKPCSININEIAKTAKPKVSFRGTSSPLKLPGFIGVRDEINYFFLKANLSWRIKNWPPRGYLLRRRAILSCLRQQQFFEIDFVLNPSPGEKNYKDGFDRSLNNNHYFICAAGFGNYSYRLYEVLRAGRIPVLIESDQMLPCEDQIDWNNLIIKVPEVDVMKTASVILDFHHSIHPDDFISKQMELKSTFNTYFTKEGFAEYVSKFLLNRIPMSL